MAFDRVRVFDDLFPKVAAAIPSIDVRELQVPVIGLPDVVH